MTRKETILAFVDAINAHDPDGLAQLMSDDHTFIDAHGNEVSGREQMLAGWRGYFEWFPDYSIEVTDVFEGEELFGLFGYAGGSFKGNAAKLALAGGVEGCRSERSHHIVASLCRHKNSV